MVSEIDKMNLFRDIWLCKTKRMICFILYHNIILHVFSTGPQREYDIEAKIQQVMSMGFDEVGIRDTLLQSWLSWYDLSIKERIFIWNMGLKAITHL